MHNHKPKILLAEDDANLGVLLVEYLEGEGFEVLHCTDGDAAAKAYDKHPIDLCLLDVMMPKVDGFSVARDIRKRDKEMPIIFITAKSMKDDKQTGYDLGADDYITKPFDEEELLWKIKALIRRTHVPQPSSTDTPIQIGRYTFLPSQLSLTLDGQMKRLTEKESEILKYLYDHRNSIIKREKMLKDLWGKNDYFLGRSLDVFITKIRKYLKDDPQLSIENVFKVGFVFHANDN